MKKNMLIVVFAVLFLLSSMWFATTAEENFSVIKVPYAEGEELFATDYQQYSMIRARYKDDKTPIPLSMYYGGYVYATVPSEYLNREIEVFIAEKVKFADNTEEAFEFYNMEILSAVGIIKGDNCGRALPYENITRAEATAMVLRLLGIGELDDTNSGFSDVVEEEWYAKTVTTAVKCGIVKGDTENTFSPLRNVSREEMTVMTARAMWYAGLQKENTEITLEELKKKSVGEDEDLISDWALTAYETVGNYCIKETVHTEAAEGEQDSFMYLQPQKSALRWEAAEMLARVCEYFQIYPSEVAVNFGFDKEMPVVDGSTSTYPFTENVYRRLFSNGYEHPDKPLKHSKSHSSYERLINGEVDMLFASVYPASDILKHAEENGVELELIPIAYNAMIFFTNIENPAENLTTEQITSIYVDNSYENWKELGGENSLLYPYCRNNDSGSHAQMERHFLNGNEINETIRKETTSVSMSNVLTDVINSKTDDPKGYGLGYSIYYYFHNMDPFFNTRKSLKLLSIDGVKPTDETIADGTYPLSNNTYVVLRKDEPENSPARKMAEFMLSDAGQYCVELSGFGPLKQKN